ncbi:MAG: S-layer homology domain-containing protein, partial [Acidobacteriota bacterium]
GTSYFAPVDLPAGASVVNVCGFTYDNSATASAEFSWIAWERGDATANAVATVLNTASTGIAATPGFDQTCVPLTTPTLIRKFDDINGDGHPHYVSYMVGFSTTAANSSVEFGGAVITWLRTVSPAPAAATFADVPTNFLYFRAIEALAASGITSGCGGGNFCPNGTVTRGEMAAFLARALGLHWPM